MSCPILTVLRSDESLQELIRGVEDAVTLSLMVLAAWRLGKAIAVKIIEGILSERAMKATTWPTCPKCHRATLISKGMRKRAVITLIGEIHFQRRHGKCPWGCELDHQIAPFDQDLGLAPRQRVTDELKRAACALIVFVPYGTAVKLLEMLCDVKVSAGAIWNWAQEAGTACLQQLQKELDAYEQGVKPTTEVSPDMAALPLVLGADGVFVPFRPNKGTAKGRVAWREVKVAIIARLGSFSNRVGKQIQKLKQRRLVAVLGSIDDLTPRMELEAHRQGIATAEKVAWISDGGRGFWRLFTTSFAQYGQGILDFYHAAENLSKGAKAWLDGRTKRCQEWFSHTRHLLRHSEADQVLREIASALEDDDLSPSAQQTLENLYHYLESHRTHIDYEHFKEKGLPIGSGMVESACKWLIQQRFKGVGMRWSDEGFTNLLMLRLAWVNGRFSSIELSPIT